MSTRYEGGRNALAGYLYQIVGSAAIAVWTYFPEIRADAPEWVGSLRKFTGGQVYHERYGDAAVESPDTHECILVEFKYSQRGQLETIGPVDLKEIADALHREQERAESEGLKVVGYELVTNRRVGREGKELLCQVKAESDGPKSPLPDSLTRVWQWRILHRLGVQEEIPDSKWYNDLRAFARRYGLFDSEIEEGIGRLVTAILEGTRDEGGKEITCEELTEKLVGYPDASQLTPEEVAKTSRTVIEGFLGCEEEGLARETSLLMRRHLLEEINQAVVAGHALIVLCGDGGCGKTVTLQQWAEELATTDEKSTGAFTTLAAACHVPNEHWVAEVVSDWRNAPGHHGKRTEKPELAMERVRIANEGLSPLIVHLGLDGVDEDLILPDRERWVREIVNPFWERERAARRGIGGEKPQAVLVVTCRELEDFEDRWIGGSREGWEIESGQTKEVRTDVFEPDELREAAKIACDPDVADRIEATLQQRSSVGMLAVLEGRLNRPSARADVPGWHAADPEVVEALLHPLMYGAFLRVGERDLQMALLEGDQITKQKLAEIFLSRFIRRAKDRLAHNLKKGEVESLLCTVACACDGATQHTREYWKTAACGTSFVNDTQAERWYGEARSGGLITRGNAQGSWIWRHRIVWEYLAQQGTV